MLMSLTFREKFNKAIELAAITMIRSTRLMETGKENCPLPIKG